ncbi:MAG TPA: tetratricopeptide repeat protein [Polyangiales bacterium]|nr:tetratricopeptide repeat protein [Polyangiales bacterium]
MSTTDFEGDPELLPYLTLDDRSGPAARLSRERALAMVDTALAELPQPMAAPRKAAGLTRGALVAAAVLLGVVGGAAAARWYFAERAPAPPAAAPAPAAQPRAAAKPVPQPEPPIVEAIEPSAPEELEPAPRARVEHAAPEDLLQKANRLRTLGRFRDAAQTYSAVADRYPKTLSAYVSQVAAASIELEHLGNAARARRLFERALREHPEGALDLEARQGLATALRDLGEERAETAVLRKLIEMHAGSPAARRATERLRELGAE